ncbi:hypothetical protein [Cesiribacter andamanensis]|uniref:SHOCT domain-containing protein n=1 Tax=Cesiribacter andamanensis AMV16 TaxID=1279009 RepID=M7NZB2_9BACT|nr:hypothetical protein [Cesiribacter andamanensis]EMR03689.1 hypothetical protein ADICEAN_01123 [Cesiribacter andamanensis AMV16]
MHAFLLDTGFMLLFFGLYLLGCWLIASAIGERGGHVRLTFLICLLATPAIGLLMLLFYKPQEDVAMPLPDKQLEEAQKLQLLKTSGLISEEEYKERISKLTF